MVRIYCLSRVIKISPISNNGETLPYDDGADELLSTGKEEEETSQKIKNSEMSEYYELTEICIGYKFFNGRKMFVMHIYRDDTKLIVIRMVRGAISFKKGKDYICDLFIATSKLFPGILDEDLHISIRWIKNTSLKGKINKDEKEAYDDLALRAKMCQVALNDPTQLHDKLDKLPFELPNNSKAKVLKQKLRDFSDLINLLCHPIKGSYKQVPSHKGRLNQKVFCYLAQNEWKIQNPRQDTHDIHAKNNHGYNTLLWSGVNFDKHKIENFNPENITIINFENVTIFDLNTMQLHSSLKDIHFPKLKECSMNFCHLQGIHYGFFKMFPASLSHLNLRNNNITFVSKNIANLSGLEILYLDNNKNLTDEEFPWEYLPPSLIVLSLGNTNISNVPTKIQRLCKLKTLNVSSKTLKNIKWTRIPTNIEFLNIEAGDELNDFDLSDKTDLKKLSICNAGLIQLYGLDSFKLPPNAMSLNFRNNHLSVFYFAKDFPYLTSLNVANNRMTALDWEFLPKTLIYLSFEHNYVKEIGNISHLINLKIINGNFNQINNVSDYICRLQNLSTVYLKGNEISLLPKNFENLVQLETLDLSSNKFNNTINNLNEALWVHLPADLKYLNISNNSIQNLSCHLKQFKFTDLRANDCELREFCSNLFSSGRPNMFINIDNNPMIQHLPFIPYSIFQPFSSYNFLYNSLNVENFTLISSNQQFVSSSRFPKKLGKPQYLFKEISDQKESCKCCANCGEQTDNSLIEQMMVMDFRFQKLTSQNKPCTHDILYPYDLKCQTCPPLKFKFYLPGKWNSVVKTRLCSKCINTLKQKTDDAFEIHKKLKADAGFYNFKIKTVQCSKGKFQQNEIVPSRKRKNSEFENSEYEISESKIQKQIRSSNDITINTTYLILKNLLKVDCFLIAAVNAIDSMEILKELICSNKITNISQIELVKILQRKNANVQGLRKTFPQYASNEQEDAASALMKLIKSLDYVCIELLQFTYITEKICHCEKTKVHGARDCNALSLAICDTDLDEITFNDMLSRWISSNSKECQQCKTKYLINRSVKIGDRQQYLIVDIDSRVYKNGYFTYLPISSQNFNIDAQLIFDVPWMLVCAIEYKGDSKHGHYLTWRRYFDKWIVISDDYYTFENQLHDDLSHYKILVYAKDIDNLENEGYATFYPQENDDGINEDRMVYGEPFQDNYKISACELEINENLHPKNINCEFPILFSGNCQNSFTKNEDIVNYNTSNNQQYSQIFENNDIIMNENNPVCDQTPIVYETAAVNNQNTENENSSAMQMDCVENNATNLLLSTFSDYFNDSDVNMLPLDPVYLSYQNSQLPMTNYSAEKVTEFTAVPFGDNISEQNFSENFFHARENTANTLPSAFSHYHTTLDTHNFNYNAHHYNLLHQNNGETYVEQNCYYQQPYQHNIGQTLHHQINVDVQITELPSPTQVSATGYQDYQPPHVLMQPPATFQSENPDNANMTIENNNRQNNSEDVIDWGNLFSEC